MNELVGTGVALVSPFTADLQLDIESLRSLVRHCYKGGVDYLVILGTTGESVTLNKDEKKLVIQTVIQENNGLLPLVIGIGGNSTTAVVEELEHTDLSPFAAVLSVSPYYNKPSQEGIYQHYKAIAAASSKPVILYNVPGRTGSNVLPETVIRLARDCKNIVGVKEASGELAQIQEVISGRPDGFLVISGDDATAKDTVKMGGQGVISVLGQALPDMFSRMIREAAGPNTEQADALHRELEAAMELIFEEGNPSGIKAMLQVLGICDAFVRLPLTEATGDLKSRIATYMKTVSGINA
ncbi:MAG: 4-hydroxy-tetrahydrodipicolinate synthase [Eudoraea sp.]|nr:4-hydroxy-tetrahydrodipicolinate synthase [Eudoraea sp.]